MSPHIEPPSRRLDQVITSMVNAFGGYKVVASMCMVAPVSVSKWMEDPSKSGQTIAFTHLLTLLAFAGEALTNYALQNAVDELLNQHVLSLCHRRAYLEEKVFAMVEMLQGQRPQSRAAGE